MLKFSGGNKKLSMGRKKSRYWWTAPTTSAFLVFIAVSLSMIMLASIHNQAFSTDKSALLQSPIENSLREHRMKMKMKADHRQELSPTEINETKNDLAISYQNTTKSTPQLVGKKNERINPKNKTKYGRTAENESSEQMLIVETQQKQGSNQNPATTSRTEQKKEMQEEQVVFGDDKHAKIFFGGHGITRKNGVHARDPLGPQFNFSSFKPLNLTLRTEYLGVLLDAGRHYFSIDWLRRMIDMLSILQFNVIHFRLTDDQAFNVRLKSQPDLAYPTLLFDNDKVYTPEELRDLVVYAKSRNISIIPEINVPGHAGSWAGIPGLTVQCPKFTCRVGYGVPLNVAHPELRSILTDVLQEVIDIFDDPPFFHLGGDEVHMSADCFKEAGTEMFDYSVFEDMLVEILQDIGYPEEQVMRWQSTVKELGPKGAKIPNHKRAEGIAHFWHNPPGETQNTTLPFFGSAHLYMDTNRDDMAWDVFYKTREWYYLPYHFSPVGIIVGTFELGEELWWWRNVVGRLLAVTVGVSTLEFSDQHSLAKFYMKTCSDLGFELDFCLLYGAPTESYSNCYSRLKNVYWGKWKQDICARVPPRVNELEANTKSEHRLRARPVDEEKSNNDGSIPVAEETAVVTSRAAKPMPNKAKRHPKAMQAVVGKENERTEQQQKMQEEQVVSVDEKKRKDDGSIPVAAGEASVVASSATKPMPHKDVYHRKGMHAPVIKRINSGAKHEILIRWDKVDGATSYELQMMDTSDNPVWKTVDDNISGTEIQTSMSSHFGHQFRVRPKGVRNDPDPFFSNPAVVRF